MDEYEMLKVQMSKPASPAVVAAIALWGIRLHQSTQELAAKLERQLAWLDANTCSKNFVERENEWLASLHQYEQSCRLLDDAAAVL